MSIIRVIGDVEPPTPPTGKIYFWYDTGDAAWKYKLDTGISYPLVAMFPYTPEDVANKATNFSTINNTLYPTTQAIANLLVAQAYAFEATIIGTSAPLSGGGDLSSNRTISITKADAGTDGYLDNADFIIFAAKVSASRTINTTAPLTGGGDLSADLTIAIPKATASVDGYLDKADFAVFAAKQPAGAYITGISGDLVATGPGAVSGTIQVGAVTDTKASLAVKPSCGVVATTNQALTGTPTIDGQATAAGTLILLTGQSSGSENGPWVAAAGAWSRPTWYPSAGTTQAFQFISTFIRLGTIYAGSTWRMTTSGAITIDTTATTWAVVPVAINSSTLAGILPVYNISSINSNTAAVSGKTYLADTSGGVFNLTLPAPALNAYIIVKDKLGTFQTNNLTIVRNASEKIEGLAASYAVTGNFSSITLISDGTDWYFV